MPLTSIYGTVYNNAKYVENCLNSLVDALPNFDDDYELVIVDNYSTDGTFKKLLKFSEKHKNVKLLRVKCTRGKGRDIALKNTSGDYVFYIDFDDVFEKEFGVIIEKLKKLCTRRTIWQYGFSTRDTSIEVIGGWMNLNYGEDWEFFARAISKNVIMKTILSPSFRITPKMKIREARYTKGISVTYMVRKVKNNIDLIRGWNPNFRFLTSLIMGSSSLFKPSTLLTFFIYPISKLISFKHFKNLCNIEACYKNTIFLFPEDIGLPKDWLFILWEHPELMRNTVLSRIKELITRDENLKIVLVEDKLVCTRNPQFIEKYV